MNYYIVVEGKCGEPIVYPEWINHINHELQQVDYIHELVENNYYLISGDGFPNYLTIINNAILDVQDNPNIDKLIIAVDSEDWSVEERRQIIIETINNQLEPNKYHIIIQNPCLEAWALGNKYFIRRNPEDRKLREYIRLFDVRENDPELLPENESEDLNKAQFAFRYLKKGLNDRYRGLTYTKHNPRAIADIRFFERIQQRCEESNHLKSFKDFLDIFRSDAVEQ